MQGIILAAGKGKRLGKYTEDIPKVLVDVNGTPLLLNALQRLYEQGVNEVIIVVGYMKEKIVHACGNEYHGMKITYVVNEQYETTNNVVSFYLATKYIQEDAILVEGDLLFGSNLLPRLLEKKHECNILVSKYNPDTMDGTVILAEGEKAKLLLVNRMQGADFDYSNVWKTVNVYMFGKEFLEKKLAPAVALYVNTGNLNSYYELVIGSLIYYGDSDISIVPISEEEWFEIDDEQDLLIAKEQGIGIQ